MTRARDNRLVIAGCGPGAPDHVTPRVRAAVDEADVLAGARRLLALFPGFRGIRVPIGAEIKSAMDLLARQWAVGRRIVVLVTGDPGVCSLAQPLVRRFGAERCRIIPGISSVQAAFAGLGVEWTDARIVNAHAGVPVVAPEALARERAVAVVGGNAKTWPWVLALAGKLERTHRLYLCRDLSLPGESIRPLSARGLKALEPGGGLSILVWVRKDATTAARKAGRRAARVYFVGAGPGDPELLTRKAERLLRECRCCIWAGSLVNPALLDLLPPDAERHDSAGLTLDEIVAIIESRHREGVDVVRLHTGEPALFGAIGEQMRRLDRLGIEYEVVPGVSSFQAAAAAIKCELTAPEVSQAVLLTRAPGRTPVPEAHTLEKVAPLGATLCVFLSTDWIEAVVRALQPAYGSDCPAAVVYHASWPDEKVVRGTLATIAAGVRKAGLTKTGMILVGRALGGSISESRLYSAGFSHGCRKTSSRAKHEDTP